MKHVLAYAGLLICSFSLIADQCNPEQPFYEWCVQAPRSCEPNNFHNACNNIYGKTFFSIRPQDSNSVRRLITMPNVVESQPSFVVQREKNFATVTFEYERSFRGNNIGTWFFFNGNNCMTFGVPNRSAFTDTSGITYEPIVFDVDGSQFGLSAGNATVPDPALLGGTLQVLKPGAIGIVSASPTISNFILDFDARFNIFGQWWIEVDLPLVHTRTAMNLCSSGLGQTTQPFPAGLFETFFDADNTCPPATPVAYSSIPDALCGGKSFGSVPTLKAGKYSPCTLSTTKLAAIHLDMGYDFYDECNRYLAASVHIAAPTGTRPNGEFVFEPVVGANKSWQVGATIQGDIGWSTEKGDYGFYWYAIATHLFKSRQTRLFSLKPNGPGSQYLLLKQIDASTVDVRAIERTANVFAGETKIGAAIMFDGSLMVTWEGEKLSAGLGYNLWARSPERRAKEVCFRNYDVSRGLSFGVKGNELVTVPVTVSGITGECEPDETTASASTIALPGPADSDEDSPVFIGISDINFSSPLHPGTWSHKFFGTVQKNVTLGCYESFFVLGAAVEFGNKNKIVNYGSVFLQGGMTF